ncbi:response regulator [uncultured Enterovirga sp.]|uniref:response regulator n=1 Tax=uncultured Enterovirga sp. TaxID=2026352 RepID=UPI0035CB8912
MLKVMIAEDSAILADVLEEFLIWKGYDVCGIARTVNEAVTIADSQKPDLAVLDFRLADGAFGSEIRPLLEDRQTMGILYVSGDPLGQLLTLADGDAYIQKPYGLDDLVRALRAIREIKTGGPADPSSFPRGFQLLREPPVQDPCAA